MQIQAKLAAASLGCPWLSRPGQAATTSIVSLVSSSLVTSSSMIPGSLGLVSDRGQGQQRLPRQTREAALSGWTDNFSSLGVMT